MKITIEKGESMQNALMSVLRYYQENYPEYNTTKDSGVLYLTLKTKHGKSFPNNEDELRFLNDKLVNIEDMRREQAVKSILQCWKVSVQHHKKLMEKTEQSIVKDKEYIDTAVVKNRKPSYVEKRKTEMKGKKKLLKEQEEILVLLEKLDMEIKDKRYTVYIRRFADKSLDAVLQFKNVDGFTGYYSKEGLKAGVFKR